MIAPETREARIVEIVTNAPQSAQNTLRRAFSGAASPRMAIKAQCLACTGYDRNAVQNCTGWSCPLWAYRPFPGGKDERPPDKGKAALGLAPDAASEITDKQNANTTGTGPGKGAV